MEDKHIEEKMEDITPFLLGLRRGLITSGVEHWEEVGDELVERVENALAETIKETEERIKEEWLKKIKGIPNKGFPIGERPWCVVCSNRIKKHLNLPPTS